MSKKETIICAICKKECLPEEDVAWLTLPSGKSAPVHMSHSGVSKEYGDQKRGTMKK